MQNIARIQRFAAGLALVICSIGFSENFKGTLFEKGSQRKNILFYFKHEDESQKGTLKKITNTFTDAQGNKAVSELATFDELGNIKTMTIEQFQTSEQGSLEVKEGKLLFQWTKEGKTKTAEEKLTSNLVVGPSTVPYLLKNWSTIEKGDTVEVRFAALDRRETVGFSFFKTEEKKVNGRDVVVVKMKATSFIIAAIVDPLYFTFDKETKKLVELVGRTLPKRKVGNSWKDLDVEITYEYPNVPIAK